MLTVASVSVAYGEQVVLDAASLSVKSGARIALCGANGSGKSTLLRIAAGLTRPDSGSVNVASGTRVGYLPQSGVGPTEASVGDELRQAFEEQLTLERELRRVEEQLAEERDEAAIEELLIRYQKLVDAVGADAERERDVALSDVLAGLGFSGEDAERDCREFSSGWQMRIALGRVLLRRADILLLDEPSNYLDLDARQWLERYLRGYQGAYAIVAHDRELLDRTCDEVVEVYRGSLTRYACSFSSYLQRREAELDDMARRYEEQQQEIARIESFVRKYRANASKARMVQSRVKYLERLSRLEPPPVQSKVAFQFPPAPRSGQVVVAAEELSVRYGERRVLSEVSVAVERGDRLALVGSNGVGKSTLLRALVGAVPAFAGNVRFGSSVEVGYFSPEGGGTTQVGTVDPEPDARGAEHAGPVLGGNSLVADLAGSQSVLELAEGLAPHDVVPHVRGLLGAFLFRGDEVYKQLDVLSGGERSRVALVRLLLSPTNLLLLDEPTNHLDLSAIAVLADALSRYEGSILFISHDEYFNARLATKVVRVDDSGARLYPGDWEYYIWKREQELGDTERSVTETPATPTVPVNGSDNRKRSGRSRPTGRGLRAREEELMRSLERLEARAAEIHQEFGRPEVLRDGTRSRALKLELETNTAEQAAVSKEWEEVHQG